MTAVEPLVIFIKPGVKRPGRSSFVLTTEAGSGNMCPELVMDHQTRTVEMNWPVINVIRLSRKQFRLLECLLDMEMQIKQTVLSWYAH